MSGCTQTANQLTYLKSSVLLFFRCVWCFSENESHPFHCIDKLNTDVPVMTDLREVFGVAEQKRKYFSLLYKVPQTEYHKFHCCLKVLKPGGQDQGVCTTGSFQGPWRRPGLSPWLADGLLLSVPLHVMFLLCVSASVSQLFLFIRTSFILD